MENSQACERCSEVECECEKCKVCGTVLPEARVEYGFITCIQHSDEKHKDHKPGVVNSLGLHEKYFPEGR